MNHIYLRVSTDHQDAENQKTGILAYLTERGQTHVMLHTDTASGAVSWRERGLLPLLEQCEPGDTIICAEVSRIGRSTVDVLDYQNEPHFMRLRGMCHEIRYFSQLRKRQHGND